MIGASRLLLYGFVGTLLLFIQTGSVFGQNYERYKPLELGSIDKLAPDLPEATKLPDVVEDDRELVASLDAVVIVDDGGKIVTDESIDDLEGINYRFDASDSIVFRSKIRRIVQEQLGKPITLRRINELSRDIISQYRACKLPIVDVLIPEQRITTGTLHIVVTESRIGEVIVEPGCYFSCDELSRWIECTQSGHRIYEPNIENDLLWLNQNPFRRVSVDFKKGSQPGTTDVVYSSKDVRPLRGYAGIDDSGVDTLNYGRFFTGFSYGNFLGRGGTLGYQYTADEQFALLEAHSLSYTQPLTRRWSATGYGSWAGVSPRLGGGLNQDGESWQLGASLVRNLIRTRNEVAGLSFGVDFKSTNNNLEFAGTTVVASNADLLQLHVGLDHFLRGECQDDYASFRMDGYVGPGGGMTGAHSAAAFQTIRPGTSPDYIYGRLRYEDSQRLGDDCQLVRRFTGQIASERLLFSETLGLGGFDSLRGFDQRAYNADNGWIANFEFGPRTWRWGLPEDQRSLRAYTFMDFGNGYLNSPLAGEDAYTMAISTGVGARFQISDRFIARFDFGDAITEIDGVSRTSRMHFGLTYIPGARP